MFKDHFQISSPTALDEFRTFTTDLAIEGDRRSMVRDIILRDPSTPSTEIMNQLGISVQELIEAYKALQTDEAFQLAVNSPFYSRKIMFTVARTVVRDFDADPEYVAKLVAGEPVSSRVVELHTTKGTCNYSCAMCLWSDKRNRTYETQQMKGQGLLSLEEWKSTLVDMHSFGAKTAVFSGGGEVLLNSDFFQVLDFAHSIGFRTHLFTSGYNMHGLSDHEWSQLLSMDRIRFSIHASNEETYNAVVGMPANNNALLKVQNNVTELLQRRNASDSNLKIGIGFVIQPLNVLHVEDMVAFAKNMGVDYLNIRRDEILVTNPLSTEDEQLLREQLVRIRSGMLQGQYGQLEIDFSDNLTAFMNSEDYSLRQASSCVLKSFRASITPFGQLMPCDLKAEPMYADPDFVIGDFHEQTTEEILTRSQQMVIPTSCTSCMPSGQTGNAIFTKLLQDYALGIAFRDQPFY